jgi:DNA-binding PadR family transcriptional regulator
MAVSCRRASRRRPESPTGLRQHGDEGDDERRDYLLQICLLLVLQDGPASAQDLRARMRPLGLAQRAGVLESALDALVGAGSVRCALQPSIGRSAPAYAVTADGDVWLREASTELRRTEVVLGDFLARCGERLLSRP